MSNLIFTPTTPADGAEFFEANEESGFSAEWNARTGSFYFENSEDTMDELEKELQMIIDEKDINGSFEVEENNE